MSPHEMKMRQGLAPAEAEQWPEDLRIREFPVVS